MPLTDVQIRSAKPDPSRTIKLSDGGGLQLWIQPTGSKLWNLAYRYGEKQKKLAIGPYPTIALKDARDRREEAKRLLLAGIDPSQHKRSERLRSVSRSEDTFAVLSAELVAKKRLEGKASATIDKVDWLLGLALPDLGPRPIRSIAAPEVLATLRKVESRGRQETARRIRSVIGEVFRYAVATGRADSDPVGALKGALAAPVVTHRPAIIDPAGFGGVLRTVDGHDGAPEVRFALQLLALTFTRPGELRQAEWTEFNLADKVWNVPAHRMKMRRPHRVPLSTQVIRLLTDLRDISGHRTLLFPGIRDWKQPISNNTLNAALRRLGYTKNQMTAHGFRAAASSILNESGKWNADAIEAQLAHLDGNSIRRVYARAEYWDERVRMMQWWADRCDLLREGVAR